MSKAKFILKEPNSKEETLIYLLYNYQYKRFKYSTGEKINPKFWNKSTHRVKATKQFTEYPEFNARLDKIANGINNAFRKLLNDGIQPNNINIKQALEIELSDHILKPNRLTFFRFIEEYIEESKLNKKAGTIKVYNTVFTHLKEFSKKQNRLIDFDMINLEFYNQYLGFLKKEQNLANNTIGKHIKTIKSFLNEATERGINTNLDFKSKKFKTISEEADTVYLTVDELKEIEKLDLNDIPRLDITRDLFLIGCYTGLRFSDFTQINPENIIDNSIIEMRTRKTNQRVSIPLHKTVKSILKKYNNKLPKAYVNQKMNVYLKEVVGKAEINELIETTITKGGKVEKNTLPKSKLVSTHTARRSFATNLYLANVPSISIMKITGHRTESSFLRYIRVSQKENADKLLTHPFFN
ncbi:site-specific integrase [Gaetbulibacter sp. M235]|uniref:site-specific integrase n=1 Tax=Gaetbulibacter sp. M235 TaxID=3126510 RepID=UPI00374E41D8